ncbi:hypothetical protein ACFE04_009776 [Oxalis oulophora]
MNFSGDEMSFLYGNEFRIVRVPITPEDQIPVRSNHVPVYRNDQNQLGTPNWQELPRFANGYVQDISSYNRPAQNFIPVLEQGYSGHYVNLGGRNRMINHIAGNYMQHFEEAAGWGQGGPAASLLAMNNAFSGGPSNANTNSLEMRYAASGNGLVTRNANFSNIVNGIQYTNLSPVYYSQVQNLHSQASDFTIPNMHSQVGDWRRVNSASRCFVTNAPGTNAGILQDQMPNCKPGYDKFASSFIEQNNLNQSPKLFLIFATQPTLAIGRTKSNLQLPLLKIISSFSADGFPVPYNLNLAPTEVYADSNVNASFQQIEVQTPSSFLNSPVTEISRQENVQQVVICTANNEQTCDELLHNLVDSSSAVVPNLVEEKGGSEGETDQLIDLNKTPSQKTPKRRKHRPKVIVEGKPKRVTKPVTEKERVSKQKTAGKRKYVRKKALKESVIEQPEITRESKNPDVKSCRRILNFDSEITGDELQVVGQRRNGGASNLNSELRIGRDNCIEKSLMLKSQQNVPPEGSQHPEAMYESRLLMSHDYIPHIQKSRNIDARNANPCQNAREDSYALVRQNNEAEGIGDIIRQARKFCENPDDGTRNLMLRNSNSTPHITSSPREIRGSKREHCHTFNQFQPNPTDGLRRLKKKKTENGPLNIPGLPHVTAVKGSSGQVKPTGANNVNANKFISASNHNMIFNPQLADVINVEEDGFDKSTSMVSLHDINKHYTPELTQARNLASQSTIEKCNFVPLTPNKTIAPAKVQLSSKTPRKKVSEQKQNSESTPSKPSPSKKGRQHKEKNQVTNDNQQSAARTQVKPSNPTNNISVDEIIHKMSTLNIYGLEQQALVPYINDGTMVPCDGLELIKKRKPRAKVDLDPETSRIWNLLMGNEVTEGLDEEAKEKKWEEEREVFRGRADSFIARMHLVQGDRRFSKWKGSVVDSVIGVFLTQNVSDHLSSSAFMCLAARFQKKPANILVEEHEVCVLNTADSIDWITEEITHRLLSKSAENRRRSRNAWRVRKRLMEAKSQNFEEIMSSQDSNDFSIIHGSEGIKSSSLSNLETENPVTWSTSKKYKGSTSQPEINKSNSFEEFCNQMNGSPLFQTNLPRALQLEGCETNGEESISSCTANVRGEWQNKIRQHNPDVSKVSEKVFERKRMTAKDNQNLLVQTQFADNNRKTKSSTSKKSKAENAIDWDSLRKDVLSSGMMKERSEDTKDSMDYEALRRANVKEISDAIKERGMNNMLAERIKDFLDRIVRDHGSMDLEWLRDVPPEKTKDYLLSFRGLGLKSVECVRLLTLHHLAFPVDTNVGRIVVRLGWVPLQPLPESLQLHLLELYPLLETIQKYLWPRLCKLDQRTLYELHYQMITFGKVFCTKSKPNCNACPMRADCRHFASAFASARLALPGPEEKSIVSSVTPITSNQNPVMVQNLPPLCLPANNPLAEIGTFIHASEPIIEEPTTPEPDYNEIQETDIEDFYEDPDEIPTIKLNIEEFTLNLQNFVQENRLIQEGDLSRALVALNPQSASIPVPKLKNISRLRTEHYVYELPDSHPLLKGMDKREPDDPSPYLLAIWAPGETANSTEPPEERCKTLITGNLCDDKECFACSSKREARSQTVRGTILIPCRTAMRGSFPLNGTYFQVNEASPIEFTHLDNFVWSLQITNIVFADHESSMKPIDVPREWIWELERRIVCFGTSVTSIFKGKILQKKLSLLMSQFLVKILTKLLRTGLPTEGIQHCFWRGFICVRGFDQKTRAPKPLMARLHFPASRTTRSKAGNEARS